MIISRAWRARGAPVRPVTRVTSAQDALLFFALSITVRSPIKRYKKRGSTGAEDFNNIDVNKHLKKKTCTSPSGPH